MRPATKDDAGAIQAIYAPLVEKSAISFEEAVPTVEDMARRIGSTLETHPYLVAELDGHVIGYAVAGLLRNDVRSVRLSNTPVGNAKCRPFFSTWITLPPPSASSHMRSSVP